MHHKADKGGVNELLTLQIGSLKDYISSKLLLWLDISGDLLYLVHFTGVEGERRRSTSEHTLLNTLRQGLAWGVTGQTGIQVFFVTSCSISYLSRWKLHASVNRRRSVTRSPCWKTAGGGAVGGIHEQALTYLNRHLPGLPVQRTERVRLQQTHTHTEAVWCHSWFRSPLAQSCVIKLLKLDVTPQVIPLYVHIVVCCYICALNVEPLTS